MTYSPSGQPVSSVTTDGCGVWYDDEHQSTICPHEELNPPQSALQVLSVLAVADDTLTRYELGSPAREP